MDTDSDIDGWGIQCVSGMLNSVLCTSPLEQDEYEKAKEEVAYLVISFRSKVFSSAGEKTVGNIEVKGGPGLQHIALHDNRK